MSTTPRTRVERRDERQPAATRVQMTSRELEVWRSLMDTINELRRVLGSELQASGLSAGDYQVLLALFEAGDHHLRSAELAAAIDWERSRLSHHLGRMERRGLVERRTCAEDGRGADVVLTATGSRMFRRATAPHLRSVKRHFSDGLTPDQVEALADVVAAMRRHLERGGER
jgi:DNA-binding MarR family transcriptional regulator